MKITPTTLTINQLLSSTNEQFVIPAYQRRYSWGEKQWADLFHDIRLLNQNDSHLLGNILCLVSDHSIGINALELVDGQQRTTTLTILIKALSDKFKEMNNDELHKEMESMLTCKGFDRVPKRKLTLGDLDDPDFVKFLENHDIESLNNKRFIEAYNFFKSELNNFSERELFEFVHKLKSNTFVIRLDVANAKDAYKLFETINNRGLKLSPTDIIKNFVLGHASLIDENTLDKVKDYWTKMIINLDGINTDDFFRQCLSYVLKKKITRSNIIPEFKKLYFSTVLEAEDLNEFTEYEDPSHDTDDDVSEDVNVDVEEEDSNNINGHQKITIIDFAQRLRNASNIYRQIRNQAFKNKVFNRHLRNLVKIKSFPSNIFLLDLFQRNVHDKEKIQILKLIETFMLRRHVCEYRTGELDTIFANLVHVQNENISSNVKEKLSKHLPSDNEFRDKFSNNSFNNNEGRAKYVLEQIEYDLINDQGEYTLNAGNELHLEHIIPQKITTKKSKREFGDWESYLGKHAKDLHRDYVNRIGNLTLLAQSLNISASNNPFKAKVEEYKKSNIHITKNIAEYSEFKFDQVLERSKQLCEKVVELWKF
ncbi:DUF262 domain-containing protein [Tenuibacillus multivorans]|uniref:Uncharacterized conserved protein, contains ParB-like and HNH nuclease domains n=1 Tax=Tenuibacillus multivorans TaxID=237069 RepID=A0A1G9YJ79_9BACI|nr:DUF262 domain-containing protein [Tenuibacillus multivorans]GEL78693.1 hypothetical protein TMU01_29280 [Tenuibacillus multivorans]SDN08972.1 Uncharacterized conserved protein, contains ParB-like and HNH nuclease domains [Tenuibacillus multivorans]